MRFTFVSLIFLFINVFATSISPSRGDALALRRRSPNGHNRSGTSEVTTTSTRDGSTMASSKAGAMCKRATTTELIKSLDPVNVDEQHPLIETENCSVYRLFAKVDNEEVILKVIQVDGRRRTGAKTEREAWALHNVQQLLGWAHTSDNMIYYLFMKNMGVSYLNTRLSTNRILKLQREAEKFYLSHYHLTHTDHVFDFANRNNWVFRRVGGWLVGGKWRIGGKWQAELIDWETFVKEPGYEGYTDPPKPFVVDEKCVFVPWMMKVHYD